MDEWKELIGDFLEEAYSLIENLEEELLNLEKDLSDKSGIDTIFRVAHTIKGGAGAVGFDDVTKLTHIMEDVLDLVRNGKYSFNENDISLLLEVKDELEILLKAHESNQAHPFERAAGLIKSLENLKETALNGGVPKVNSDTPVTSAVSTATAVADANEEEILNPIDLLPVAARFGLTNDQMASIHEAVNLEETLVFIEIRFNESYELKEVGPFEILNVINSFTEPIIMNPTPECMDEEYMPYLNVVASCQESIEYIENKLSLADVVTRVTVRVVSPDYLAEIERGIYGSNAPTEEAPIVAPPVASPIVAPIPEPVVAVVSDDESEVVDLSPSDQVSAKEDAKAPAKEEEKRSPTLKVESSRIDDLLNLLGELVIIRSGLTQFGSDLEKSVQDIRTSLRSYLSSSTPLPLHEDPDVNIQRNDQFKDAFSLINTNIDHYIEYTQQLSRISSTLQGRMMNLRMVPIQTVFSRFTRLTRDIAKQLNKNIELVMEGGETEIDKGMIDDLYDPLMHMIRNSLDHGIEMPEDRKAAGKDPSGIIQLKAYQEGDAIFIEIADNGKGIDANKIAEKALEKGFITQNQINMMSKQEKLSLILMPGFSTAEQISNLSGRGVGMDVVHRKIEELGGSVTINSEVGVGSTIRIQLPLTLAIIQGLLIVIGGVHYIMPIASVEETIILNPNALHKLNNYHAIEFREKLIPLVSLPSILYGEYGEKSLYLQEELDDSVSVKENTTPMVEEATPINIAVDSPLVEEAVLVDRTVVDMDSPVDSSVTEDAPLMDTSVDSPIKEETPLTEGEPLVDGPTTEETDAVSIEASQEHEVTETKTDFCIIVRYSNRQVGIVIPEILREQDIVIKPLDNRLISSPGIAAATIVGNGEIGFILDIPQIIRYYLKNQH